MTEIKTSEIKRNRKGNYPCPECNVQKPDKRGLGVHRKHEHGVLGSSQASVALRQKKARLQSEPSGNGFAGTRNEPTAYPFQGMNRCFVCGADLLRGYYALKAAGVIK